MPSRALTSASRGSLTRCSRAAASSARQVSRLAVRSCSYLSRISASCERNRGLPGYRSWSDWSNDTARSVRRSYHK